MPKAKRISEGRRRTTTLRRPLVQAVIVAVALAGINVAIYSGRQAGEMRADLAGVVPAVSIVFALAGAIGLALFSSSVAGLHDESFTQARRIKERAWQAFDAFTSSEHDAAHRIADDFVREVLETSIAELRDTRYDWNGLEDPTRDLLADEPSLVFRFLLPLDDEMKEMGVLLIRRVASALHRKLIWRTFGLVAAAIAVLGFHAALPNGLLLDLLVANMAAAIVAYAPLHLLVAASWLDQEAREHGYEVETIDKDSPEPYAA